MLDLDPLMKFLGPSVMHQSWMLLFQLCILPLWDLEKRQQASGGTQNWDPCCSCWHRAIQLEVVCW